MLVVFAGQAFFVILKICQAAHLYAFNLFISGFQLFGAGGLDALKLGHQGVHSRLCTA